MLPKNKNQHWVHHYTKTYKSENKTKGKKKQQTNIKMEEEVSVNKCKNKLMPHTVSQSILAKEKTYCCVCERTV